MSIIKLETNIPLTASIKYLNYFPERENPKEPGKLMASQYGFKGTFDGIGEGQCYINEFQLAADPIHLGMAIPNGMRDGVQQFTWTERGKIQLVKHEDGRKRIIHLARVGVSAGPALGLPPAWPGGQHQPPLPPALIVQQGPQWPPPRSDVAGERRDRAGQDPADYAAHDPWAALEARYARCAEIACRVWTALRPNVSEEAVVRAANGLMVDASRQHLAVDFPTPPLSQRIQTALEQDAKSAPRLPTPDTSGPPRPEQIAQFRALLGTNDPYGGGPVFDQTERQAMMAHMGQATAESLASLIQRMQKTLEKRIPTAAAPARTAGGPGMPSQGDDLASVPF